MKKALVLVLCLLFVMGLFVMGCQKTEAPKEKAAPAAGGYGQPPAEQAPAGGGYGQPPASTTEQPESTTGHGPGESGGYGQQQ